MMKMVLAGTLFFETKRYDEALVQHELALEIQVASSCVFVCVFVCAFVCVAGFGFRVQALGFARTRMCVCTCARA